MRIGEHETTVYADACGPLKELLIVRLMASIKANGQRRPIILYDGAILSGRHRYEACVRLCIEPRFRVYDGPTDAASLCQYIIDEDIERRDLAQYERDLVIEEMERIVKGARKRNKKQATMLDGDLDEKIAEDGCDELKAAVALNQITKVDAAQIADLEPDAQRRLVERAKEPPKEHKAVVAGDQWLPPQTEKLTCQALCVRCSGRAIEHRHGIRCARCGPLVQWRR